MADRIQLRRDISTNWTSVNPVLADGEIGLEQDTDQFKIGDGVSTWANLPYGGIQGPPPIWGNITGTLADQTDLLAALDTKAPLADPEFTGNVTLGGPLSEKVWTLGGMVNVLNPSNGTLQLHTLSGNTLYTEAFLNGQAITLMVDDGAGYTITWPAITWVNNGGSAPTLATTGYTVIVLWKVSAIVYGALVGDGS